MPRYTVTVSLRFEAVEATHYEQAIVLAEGWCSPVFPKCDSIGSTCRGATKDEIARAERIEEGG